MNFDVFTRSPLPSLVGKVYVKGSEWQSVKRAGWQAKVGLRWPTHSSTVIAVYKDNLK